MTVYDERYPNYNEWVDYMLEDSNTFYFKSLNYSIWEQPCSLVALKEDANILVLDSREKLDRLRQKHPLANDKFSYEAISNMYDGIIVDMNKLLYNGDTVSDDKTRRQINRFGVNSLILFNLDCIDYYQSGVVSIEPFDFEYGYNEGTSYTINIEDTKKKILK